MGRSIITRIDPDLKKYLDELEKKINKQILELGIKKKVSRRKVSEILAKRIKEEEIDFKVF